MPFPGAVWTRIESFAKANVIEGHDVHVLGTFSVSNMKKRGIDVDEGITSSNLVLRLGLLRPPFFIINIISSLLSSILFILKWNVGAI